MEQEKTKESNVVKMQKLRHVIGRLRNIRANTESTEPKRSWFARLKARLGFGEAKEKED
jgi:hypothetical protein